MTSSSDLLAAGKRIIGEARRDLERGFYESACISSHRGAVLASEALLRARGQPIVSNSVHENVSLSPSADEDVRVAALRLDRHKVEEGYPHRSSHASTDAITEAEGAVDDAQRVLAFVERQIDS